MDRQSWIKWGLQIDFLQFGNLGFSTKPETKYMKGRDNLYKARHKFNEPKINSTKPETNRTRKETLSQAKFSWNPQLNQIVPAMTKKSIKSNLFWVLSKNEFIATAKSACHIKNARQLRWLPLLYILRAWCFWR